MGSADRCGPNLAPNVPIYTGRHLIPAGSLDTRIQIPLQWSEFTEAFLVTLVNLPVRSDGSTPAYARYLVGSDVDQAAARLALPGCQFLAPGCEINQALPGWLKFAIIDVDGVDMNDLVTPVDIEVNVIVKRLDRTVRTEDWVQ
jgi:hypothetical protein